MTRGDEFVASVRAAYDLKLDEEQLLIEIGGLLDDLDSVRGDPEQMSIRRLLKAELRLALAALGLPDSDVEAPATKARRKGAEAANRKWKEDDAEG